MASYPAKNLKIKNRLSPLRYVIFDIAVMTLATTSLQTPNVMDATQVMVKYLESISVV